MSLWESRTGCGKFFQVCSAIPLSKSLCTHTVLVKTFFIYCHPDVQGTPKCKTIGTLKTIVLHPYPTEGLSNYFYKTIHSIRYKKIWCMGTFFPNVVIFKSHQQSNNYQKPWVHYLNYKPISCYTSYFISIKCKYNFIWNSKVGHISYCIEIADEN